MTENKKDLGSDLKKVDSHIIQPEEYDEIPELDETWFAVATPHVGGKPTKRGRPRKEVTKRKVMLRIDPEVVNAFESLGKGWHTQMNNVLAEWAKSHGLLHK